LPLQTSGAKIKISDRGDYISGTTDRLVLFTYIFPSLIPQSITKTINIMSLHNLFDSICFTRVSISLLYRKVTITGSQSSIRTAESMILQKVAYATERVAE
jgi:hypothetical protein